MQITFLGAAKTVTGSKYLIQIASKNILIDCGLFQGLKELRLRNWAKLPIEAKNIDAVILSHAHIDHSGYLPLLVKNGFRGKIYCTHGTHDLCHILLPDSGRLQEEEANFANRHNYSKHHPAYPLYTEQDAYQALKHFVALDFDTSYTLFNNASFRFYHAGHIIGASIVHLSHDKITVVFTGDLGRPHDAIMKGPDIITEADYLITESTYGDRLHTTQSPANQLAAIIDRTVARGGSLIIPAFAVGRCQSILYYLEMLKKENRIADIPIFLDSPMAIDASNLFIHYLNEHKLSEKECKNFSTIAKYIVTPEESKFLDHYNAPIVIISASGMATGGRILHHLKYFLSDPKNTILFTGFQAVETRGDRLLRGEKEVKIHGEMIKVLAEICVMSNLSAHADYQELLDWFKQFKRPPNKTFITHGELKEAQALKTKIENQLHWVCTIPAYLQTDSLN